MMKFAVPLFYRGVRDDETSPVWQLTVYLIEADDEEQARAKAMELGHRREVAYRAVVGGHIRWQVASVGEVNLLEDHLKSEVELFSTFLSESAASALQEPIDV
jgi:hypothetical protein